MTPRRARRLLSLAMLLVAGLGVAAAVVSSRLWPVRAVKASWAGFELLPDDPSQGPVLLQSSTSDCGPVALAVVLGKHGLNVAAADLRGRLNVGRWGVTAEALATASIGLGLPAEVRRGSFDDLVSTSLPFVALVGVHFLVVERPAPQGGWVLYDPALGRVVAPTALLRSEWRGVAVVFAPPRQSKDG